MRQIRVIDDRYIGISEYEQKYLCLDVRQEFVTLLISIGERLETYPIKNIFS